MAVITKIKTNATEEEIKEAISGYNHNINSSKKGEFEVYMAPYDRYTLLCEDANDTLESNLEYEFNKQKKKLEFEVLKTELE